MCMSFHFMYMFILPNLKLYMYTLWVICLSCKSIYMDSIVFRDMYVYLLCWQFIHIPWNEICLGENFVFSCFHVWCFNFMYMSISFKLLIIHIHPFWATCLNAYILWTRCVWICMYTLVCIGHTYTLKIKYVFMFQGILSLIGNFIMPCHSLLVHSQFFKNISHEYVFHEHVWTLLNIECFKYYVIYMCFMKIIFVIFLAWRISY